MKRLWLVGGIFVAILTLCLSTLLYEQRQVDILLDGLDGVITAFDDGDDARAYTLALALEEDYERRTRFFPYFMAHGDLIECRESLSLLPSILKDGDTEEFHMESTRCRIMLERLAASELPTWQNIL